MGIPANLARLKRLRKKSRNETVWVRRRTLKRFQISDLRFQIEETANSNANADPSYLFLRGREAADKGVRDDSREAFLRGL
jgi:hypothetical protein